MTKILASLTPREERVLEWFWNWYEYGSYPRRRAYNLVTRERIRQIEAKALRKLKHPSRSKQLKVF